MSFDLKKILRPHIADLQPYTSARDEYSGKLGVFLDANENPFGSISEEDFNRYPDPYQLDLKEELSKIKGVPSKQIFLGNGSDEAIDLLLRACCNPGKDNIILLPPTYGMYAVSASINDVEIRNVPLTEDFQLEPEKILAAVDSHSKIIFICSPNNPSGNTLDRTQIVFLIRNFPGIVVIDEAYVDFMEEPSFVQDLEKYPNLLIMQTFSKAWGLASLRLGMAYASPEIIGTLNRIKPPYNISGLTQETVLKSIKKQDKLQEMIQDIILERKYLRTELEKITAIQKVFPSSANFLLVRIPNADHIYKKLIEEKVIVRNRSKVQLCEDSLRITVGTREENDTFLEKLKVLI